MNNLDVSKITERLEFIIRQREQKRSVSVHLDVLLSDIQAGAYDAPEPVVTVVEQEVVANLRAVALDQARQFRATRAGEQGPQTVTRDAVQMLKFLTTGKS